MLAPSNLSSSKFFLGSNLAISHHLSVLQIESRHALPKALGNFSLQALGTHRCGPVALVPEPEILGAYLLEIRGAHVHNAKQHILKFHVTVDNAKRMHIAHTWI